MKKKEFTTPYYFIDEKKLLKNLKIIRAIEKKSGAKSLLALKCFSTWSVFGLMKKYMAGTTSSSLYEVRLGREKFGGETHAYCVAYSPGEIDQIKKLADKIIFNSVSQLSAFYDRVKNKNLGLRINPGMSYSHFKLADPACPNSRLGVTVYRDIERAIPKIKGMMFHFNCENDDFDNFSAALDRLGENYGHFLSKLDWVSLGGGLYFTKEGYPVDKFCKKLSDFGKKFDVQVYLEPGESSITQCAELVTTVLDVVNNCADIAIVDASIEAHMLDLLIYRIPAKMKAPEKGKYKYTIAGRSCLAGDIFGSFDFDTRLAPGSIIRLQDAAGYTMVKKNWFNGLPMPAIVVKRLSGKTELVRNFGYKDFVKSLS